MKMQLLRWLDYIVSMNENTSVPKIFDAIFAAAKRKRKISNTKVFKTI